MDYYVLLMNDVVYHNPNNVPLTYDEVQILLNSEKFKDALCINISEDIRQYNIKNRTKDNVEDLLSELQYEYYLWDSQYKNNNLKKDFTLPMNVESNEQYISVLKENFAEYCDAIDCIAFKYNEGLLDDVKQTCDEIILALNLYIQNRKSEAYEYILNILRKNINDPFWVSGLDKSYAFRGIAPFYNLQDKDYEDIYDKMNSGDLTFYRARPECVSNRIDMLHIPYESKFKVKAQRFSVDGTPCLYMGTTSFVCWEEYDMNEEIYLSSFKFDDRGKQLKILNLVAPARLIDGIYNRNSNVQSEVRNKLQISLVKLFPLIYATSFHVNEENRTNRYEYIISQLLMDCIKEMNIDGIAYLSKKGKDDDSQYPQGINLAIPIFDIDNENQYGKCCEMLKMTKPVGLNSGLKCKGDLHSYVNKNYNKIDEYGRQEYNSFVDYNGNREFYGNIRFSKFDDLLVNEEYDYYK